MNDDYLVVGAVILGAYVLSNSKNIVSGTIQGAGSGLGAGIHDFIANLFFGANGNNSNAPQKVLVAYPGQNNAIGNNSPGLQLFVGPYKSIYTS